MKEDLSSNPLLDDVPKQPSIFARLYSRFQKWIHTRRLNKKPKGGILGPEPPRQTLESMASTREALKKMRRLAGISANDIVEHYKENDDALANLRRTSEIERLARDVRRTVKRDLGTVLRDADERRRKARKAVQVAVRRSAPWVQGYNSPYE